MLAKQIKKLRINAGMSQLQLAKELNVCPSAVGMYEQGRRTPSIDILILIAKIFSVSLDYLIMGSEINGAPKVKEAARLHQVCYCRNCCLFCKDMIE